MSIGLSAANLVGAITVFVFLGFVVPVPSEVVNNWGLLLLNVVLFVPGLVLASVFANIQGPRLAASIAGWFMSARRPTPHERAMTLRLPQAQARMSAGIWIVAGLLFTTVNAFESLRLAAMIAFSVTVGGLSSSALTYLLAERFTREITAAALEEEVPSAPAGPGVATRVVLAWALSAGIPLLGGVLLAGAALTPEDVIGADLTRDQIALTVLFLGVVGLAFGLIAMRIAARSIADPIQAVRAALRDVESGSLDAEVPVYDGSEVGLLQAGFNRMVVGLAERERLREAFGTFVDPELADRVLREGTDLAGEELEASMLFMDVRGFTSWSERTTAREVVARLNDLYDQVVPVVIRHGGHANKFIGDGMLAVFGAPYRHPDHADRAVAAGVEIADLVRERYGDELRVGVGVNTGRVLVGTVGGGGRLDFTVIGDAVNTAARVEAATRETGDDLLITEATRAALRRDRDGWQPREAVQLKGKADPVSLYAPARSA